MNIEDIKEYCIQVDLENVLAGDDSIGAHAIGKPTLTFTCEKDIRLFYYSISIKDLLQTYSSYNGLECYRVDEPEDYRKSYNVDILEIIEHL